MAGVTVPTEGMVTLNEEPVTARLTDIGYVPQQEIVHPRLTVDEALGYAARLRLPHDTKSGDRKATIQRVLSELSLEGSVDTRIGDLSGGERKRVGVASELLNRPSMLFLDEPTTGLDPALESQMMELFRNLARPGSRAVVVVTHATKNLALCDKLAVIGRGGELCFFGRPDEGLAFFGVDAYDDVYTALARRPRGEWRADFETVRAQVPAPPAPADAMPEPGPAGSPRAKQRGGIQLLVLVERYLRLLARDGRNLAILLGQVPIIAVCIALLFEAGLFGRADVGLAPEPGSPDEAVQLLFVVATTAIWFGSIDAAREIVKERAITARESAIGVGWTAYLGSKAIVLFGLATLQTAALGFVVFAIRPLEELPEVYVTVFGLLVLTSIVGVGMGLAISAFASSEDQATSFIPLALIPQLLFAGAIVPIERMTEPIAALASVVFGRWSLAGLGNAIDLNGRIAADPRFAEVSGYGESFFDVSPGNVSLILLAFLVAFLLAALFLVRRAG
jgi:ABC-type lipoprotein export system ATPase subunit